MRTILITAALLVSGCTTVEDIQSNPVLLDVTTDKGRAEVAQCFSEKYAKRPWRVTPISTATGTILSLRFETNTVRPVAAVIEIVEDAGKRRVVARSRSVDREHIRASVESCL